MKKLMMALTIAASFAVAGPAYAADKLKVGFIYIGPPGDFGWTYQHDQGRKELEKALGDKVETTFLENVPEGADAERSIERLARAGNKLIFTTSFGYMDATIKVAQKFPDVKFEHATGYKTAENVAVYNSRFYEGRYIQGVIAAKMSKAGVAGYIGSFPIPEVVQGINSFMLGAQSVNPAFKVKVIWANSWFDPAKEADAAKALIDQGVDIITQHTDSTAPMQVAAERKIKAFGQASDMIKFGPETQLTSIVDNWGPYYIERAKAVLDGTWKSHNVFEGMKEGLVVMAPYTNMPDDVKKLAEETQAKITSGELKPFTGPIKKQDGSEWLKAGETADDKTILSMNFYVAGVDDKLPK
ncbi:BMP family ABC transporter substrate-binding protein [Phyllobacterium endophyticum]|uniref:BMP family ABC transporter substrate-binding protein n=1 Tax=Phyllobacterium endophyticum TaxID=1149773 RepID=A0A2P7AVM7_9HYPH|nr:BMP family ABC transporter substrate-binding protein [Phyllobacterium endophyticum]MBB3234845.1 simple sugar transport system substrate-binding protein [Phyllobacterium endophyticum]PSH58274.1 BMP family ABC transporter substrate-binding protein [Phyllobacterium endophyticum]TXR50680.1 BMP family ABC transporter substrate-binding protein [Phyllobacterium endophyticum]TYR38956.1 BMP family ABC transporter substrate-binding protein [Phyllobacterium endophyticum]